MIAAVIWLMLVITIGILAANKGRNVALWVVMGMVLPLVLIPLLACKPIDPPLEGGKRHDDK